MEVVELGFLLDCADTLVGAALARDESRGGHYREDHPLRDDANWLKHSLAYRQDDGSIRLETKPVKLDALRADGAEVLMTPSDGLGDVLDGSDRRRAGASNRVSLTLRVRRYNPELRGDESWWDEFTIEADPD